MTSLSPSTRSTLAVLVVALATLTVTAWIGPRPGAERADFVPLFELDETGQILREDGTPERVTALSLFDADGGELLFARVRGRWRCLGHHLAPADSNRITALIGELAAARPLDATPRAETGGPVAAGPELERRLAALDLTEGRARRVVLRGPDALKPESGGDVLAELLVGRDGAVRRVSNGVAMDEVLMLARSIDWTFRPPVTLDPNQLPPLVLPFVVPPDWAGFETGLARVFVDRADGSGFELVRVADPELAAGLTAWDVRESAVDPWRRAHPILSTGYTLFLGRVPVVRAVDPRSVPESITARPDVRITLVSAQNELVELLVGPIQLDGSRLVVNTDTQVAFQIAPEPARLLTPSTSQIEVPGASIPWDPYLRGPVR
jgi:hypothetical protein